MFFQIGPQFRRQISQFMGDLEIIRHATGFFYRPVNKALFFFRQLLLRIILQFFPVRLAAKQVAFPPGRPGFNGFFFRA
ncbi:hypothetical protein D3C80_1697280 [compost metagenome]